MICRQLSVFASIAAFALPAQLCGQRKVDEMPDPERTSLVQRLRRLDIDHTDWTLMLDVGEKAKAVTGRGWERFLEQLGHLASDRHGRALLWGADPDELQLSFACDFRGEASASGYLARHRMDGLVQRLQFGFTFPVEHLASVASELKALAG